MTNKVFQLALALLILVVPVQASWGQGIKPVAVIGISNLDELFGDLRGIMETAGQADAGNMVLGLAGLYTNGLNKSKPMGAYVFLENDQPRVIAFVPVKNLKGALAMFRDQIGEPKDVGDGILQVAADKPMPFYIKEQNGFAFVAQSSAHLGTLPANPVAILGGLEAEFDISIRISVANIPAMYKQQAIAELKKGFDKSLKKVDDDDREATEKLGRSSMESIVRIIQETDDIVLGWSIDGKTRRTFLEFSLTGIAGTELAKQMSELKASTSGHAGFLQPGAAATLNFNNKLAKDDIQQMLGMIGTLKEKALKEIDDDASLPSPEARTKAKSAAETLISVLQQTIGSGKIDGGAVLTLDGDELTFAAGGYLADGSKVEDATKKLVEIAQEKKKISKVEFGYASYGGVSFHRFTRPLDDGDGDAKEIFGDELDVVVGTGKDSVYVAFGNEPEELLKKVITKSATDRNVQVPIAQFTLALGPILKFAATVEDDPKVKALAAVVDQAGGKDHIMVVARPIERGAAYRLEIEEGIIKMIGAAAKAQK